MESCDVMLWILLDSSRSTAVPDAAQEVYKNSLLSKNNWLHYYTSNSKLIQVHFKLQKNLDYLTYTTLEGLLFPYISEGKLYSTNLS